MMETTFEVKKRWLLYQTVLQTVTLNWLLKKHVVGTSLDIFLNLNCQKLSDFKLYTFSQSNHWDNRKLTLQIKKKKIGEVDWISCMRCGELQTKWHINMLLSLYFLTNTHRLMKLGGAFVVIWAGQLNGLCIGGEWYS